MTMAMSSATGTATAAAASASATGMHMDMGGPGACKISMLWNWNVLDTCFLSSSWHIKSRGMFAGSCIGVILLVMVLELLRRAGKEYDRVLVRGYRAAQAGRDAASSEGSSGSKTGGPVRVVGRPTVGQQAIRALLHMLQFAVAYFVMLLAMYYNGYIIICIFIGAYLGFFVFGWEAVSLAGPGEETTVCCG
ncbi:Ctr-domain-containing protein [Trichodelitschia bisporula]|uniref:Copper transport protein n=1 Tax=Trichodelitschia bisporula TaxID=703511 RepID=A0A6G1HP25_9PEZI|nr:Ctr-domain-containing protein [Trichodelitschia bisporula]